MIFFFHICFISLTSMYTLVYQDNKKYQGGGGPLCIYVCICILCIYIAFTLHRAVIGFKIVCIFSLNTIETLSGPLCPTPTI